MTAAQLAAELDRLTSVVAAMLVESRERAAALVVMLDAERAITAELESMTVRLDALRAALPG